MMSRTFRRALLKTAHWAARKPQLRLLRQIREHVSWSREQIESWQVGHLRKLLIYCGKHVPYYQDVFRASGFDPHRFNATRDLSLLPVLTKDLLRRRRDDLVSREHYRPGMAFDSTGGSTGRPVQFAPSPLAKGWALAAWMRAVEWTGVDVACPKFHISGHPREDFHSGLRHRAVNWIHNRYFFNAFCMSEPEMDRWYRLLRRFRPQLCLGYVTSVFTFARHLLERDGRLDSVQAAITTAELLHDHQREIIQRAFGCKTYTHYGCREALFVGSECPGGNLHLNEDVVYTECVTQGEEKTVLLTPLFNYVMPLIRYDVEDVVVPLEGPCPCGRTFATADIRIGRTADNFRLKNGTILHGQYFAPFVWDVEGVENFRFTQVALDRITLEVVPRADMDGPARRDLLSTLNGRAARAARTHGNVFRVDAALVERIEALPSGKRRYCVSLLDDPGGTPTNG